MAMSMPGSRVQVGMLVVSADGEELGRITALEEGCIKVDTLFAPDYWLADDLIDAVPEGIVRLTLSREALNEARRDGPEHQGMHLHHHQH